MLLTLTLTLIPLVVIALAEFSVRVYHARHTTPTKIRDIARSSRMVLTDDLNAFLREQLSPRHFNYRVKGPLGLTRSRFLWSIRLILRWPFLGTAAFDQRSAIRILGLARDKRAVRLLRHLCTQAIYKDDAGVGSRRTH